MQAEVLASLKPAFYPSHSEHSRQTEEFFGDSLTRELSTQERLTLSQLDIYFVVFTNRSGSNYLVELMGMMKAGMHPRAELFNSPKIIATARKNGYATFTDYLLAIVEANAQSGTVGFKISINQLFWLTRLGLPTFFRSVRVINCLRQDMLAQAVSHYRAKSTGQWHSAMAASDPGPVTYSREKLLRSLLAISNARALVDYYCALHNAQRFDLIYEELLRDPLAQLEKVAAFLQIEGFDSRSVDPAAVGIKQQRNEENDALKAEFLTEFSL
jgi:trehalose 2-sulfotransferase